jgi:hypothetical protein
MIISYRIIWSRVEFKKRVAMKLHYIVLFAMSLLFLSMEQSFASADALQLGQLIAQSQVELQKLEFPRYSTDQYVYSISSFDQPTAEGIIVAPVVISDKTVNNYLNNGKVRTLITQETKDNKIITRTEIWTTKSPSYLTWENGTLVVGAVGVATLTYVLMKEKNRRIDALEDMLKKEEQYSNSITKTELKLRKARFDRMVKEVGLAKSYNTIPAITTNVIANFSDEQFDRLIETMKKSKTLTMADFSKIYESIHDPIKLDSNDNKFNTELLRFGCKYLFWGKKYCTAAHEAGHSLVSVQNSGSFSPQYATVVSMSGSGGHMSNNATDTWTPSYVDQKDLGLIKHNIDVFFAGGIAMSIAEGKKLTFDEFLAYEKYGMGDVESEGSDIHHAYKQAHDYFRLTDKDSWLPKSTDEQYDKDILNLLKERYEKTTTFLNARKDKLAQMTNQLYQYGIISDDKIHAIAGTTKPKYFNDMSKLDQRIAIGTNWLKNAVNFHDANPYEIHEVLG